MNPDLSRLPACDPESGDYYAIIETPQGSANKLKYEPKLGLFALAGVMPAGAVFPFDFGFIPSTVGEDGDPLDVLVLMDSPAPPGCLVHVRLVGVIRAVQTEGEREERNDRLIAVACKSRRHKDIQSIKDLNRNLVEEITHFFVSYNQVRGKQFKVQEILEPEAAVEVIRAGVAEAKAA